MVSLHREQKRCEPLKTMLISLAFLMSKPGTAIEQTNINENARMPSVSETLKGTQYSTWHSDWHKIGDQFMFVESMNK